MPRTNLAVDENNRQIKAVIEKYRALRGDGRKCVSIQSIAKNTGVTAPTLYRYMDDISNAPVRVLRGIYDFLRVPREERCGL